MKGYQYQCPWLFLTLWSNINWSNDIHLILDDEAKEKSEDEDGDGDDDKKEDSKSDSKDEDEDDEDAEESREASKLLLRTSRSKTKKSIRTRGSSVDDEEEHDDDHVFLSGGMFGICSHYIWELFSLTKFVLNRQH